MPKWLLCVDFSDNCKSARHEVLNLGKSLVRFYFVTNFYQLVQVMKFSCFMLFQVYHSLRLRLQYLMPL